MKFWLALMLIATTFPLQGQDIGPSRSMENPQEAAEVIPLMVHLNTSLQDAWEFNGRVEIGRTTWRSETGEDAYELVVPGTMLEPEYAMDFDKLTPPPVPLASYTAKREAAKVRLDWTTGWVESVVEYQVQRSLNGLDWKRIGAVNVLEERQTLRHFSYYDNHPKSGDNHYRLVQIRADGTRHFGDELIVQMLEGGHHVTYMYPHPSIFGASIDLILDTQARVNIRISDDADRRIADIFSKLTSIGKHTIEIDMDRLPRGTYYCDIEVNGQWCRRSFTK
ncbi:hypothetical protein [Pontibacter sp. G13]|uniref:hypothetical protein n=1 Tax=Pontibacter sp. G13 TaxID=3074898 RepID=UPI002889BD53|nr:hypothetical protein [Pontibacter sp. G13]WNJ18815.1 hypothetical protein RJD25_28500 [Pontibacter sp. G13]